MSKIQVSGAGGTTDKTVYVGINAKRQTCKDLQRLKNNNVLLQTCAQINGQRFPQGSQSLGNSDSILEKKQTKPSLTSVFTNSMQQHQRELWKEHSAEKFSHLGYVSFNMIMIFPLSPPYL